MCLKCFQAQALKCLPHVCLQHKIWKRYIDDTFVIWPHNNSSLQEFLTHINGLQDKIKFTMEIENNNSIAFFDVLVSKNNCRLTTTVYKKPTHTDRYLNYRSNHHPFIKSGIIKCLRNRALNLCSEGNLLCELNRLYNVFRANGYPSSRINNSLKPSRLKRNEDVSTSPCNPLTKTDRKRTLCQRPQ